MDMEVSMQNNNNNTPRPRKWLLIGAGSTLVLLCALVVAFFVVPLASAAPNDGYPTDDQMNTCEQYTQDLANRLNISVDTLDQARLGAKEDVLKQMVANGKLTQAQADKIKLRLENNKDKETTCRRVAYIELAHRTLVQKYGADVLTALAGKLKLSNDQLKTELKSGKSLKEIAQAQGVSETDLSATLSQAVNSAVDKAVGAGDLTKDQGDTIKQALQKHPALLNRLLMKQWKGQ
jgi:polyhydroxyalkanoate synthesis regulator phasin